MQEGVGARRRQHGERRSRSGSNGQPLRLGIVGCGTVARERHLPVLHRMPEVAVLAVADANPHAAAEVATRFGIPRRYATAEELVVDPELDAVAICTPPSAHVDPALAALDAGKHVFVEKPLTTSLADADRLLGRAARSRGRALMGFNLRWHRLLLRARRVVREGALGWVHCMVSTFSDPLLRRELPAWRRRRDQGGGALFDRAVHHFDLWRFLLDDEVVEVYALSRSRAGDDDAAVITARLRGGAIATAVMLAESAVTHRVTLYGTEGSVDVDALRFDGFTRATAEEYPGSISARLGRARQRLAHPRGDLRAIRDGGDFDAAYGREWKHFAAVARGELEPAVTLHDGRAALAIALAAARSIESGAPVAVDPAAVALAVETA
jgi:myo-inositol 2-dehydrogenase/D-chiro-inositol 1-dehydrogenase